MWSSQRSGRVVVIAMTCLGMAVSLSLGQEPAEAQKVEIPATATTLEGIPTVRIDSAQAGATRRLLSGAEASKDRLTVTVVNGQFYWTSRGNRPLRLSSSGDFTYLSSEPGQYIRLTRLNDKISYVEHVDLGLGSVTWWGELRIAVGK